MADIELVIKIPERIRVAILNGEYCGILDDRIYNAIKNGTPLPKGHGRLIDEDEAIECIKEVEGEDAIWAIGLIEWACEKRTLIEADK